MYTREVEGTAPTFRVSGLLWNANVLMYDHQTESLWSQVLRRAVTGPRTGARLRALGSTVTTWEKWRSRYPETTVLSRETGHVRDYGTDPYEDHYRSRRGLFARFRPGPGEEEKELVAGVEAGGATRAYPVEEVRRRGSLTDTLGGREITLALDPSTDRLTARGADGEELVPTVTYWFVWKGIHRDSGRYGAGGGEGRP